MAEKSSFECKRITWQSLAVQDSHTTYRCLMKISMCSGLQEVLLRRVVMYGNRVVYRII